MHDPLRAQDALLKEAQRLALPAQDAFKIWQERDSAFYRAMGGRSPSDKLFRAALGPMEAFHRRGATDPMYAEAEKARLSLENYNKHFELPSIVQAQKLFSEMESSDFMASIRDYDKRATAFLEAMDTMRTPWLDKRSQAESLAGFVGLQNIGLSLKGSHPFDDGLVGVLRQNLGDWRQPVSWPEDIFRDPFARSAFYVDRGLDPRLTDFPAQAFAQGTSIAGLRIELPAALEAYLGEADEEIDEEEAGFERTNAAHDRIQRFETRLRNFIEERMREAWGDQWEKQRVPGEVLQAWRDRRKKARDNGDPHRPLIAYADFTDYERIIVRTDNWERVFEPAFRRKESVAESFWRLYPIRLCVAHSRCITQDDELYLYVELKRLLQAMGFDI